MSVAPEIGIRLSLDGAPKVEADLKRVSNSFSQTGVSAAQTAAAMRQVPAQFTDIITSLQAGQAPLTVLLQQGGQLKDAFGGVGNAAKALGGYVVGLINPLTVLGASAAAVAVAMYQGSKESEAYAKALIMSGNAAGVTVGRLQAQARAISAVSGATQGAAADVIAQVAASGKIGAENLGIVTEAALRLEKTGVQAVSKTIDQFNDLGKSPVEASVKLNEQYNYLTASVFKQIKALEDQGKASEAAEVAQRSLAETLSSRATQLSQNLGTLERAWGGITGAAKSAWDAMLGLGRDTTIEDKISTLQQQIAERQARNSGLGIKDGAATRELQAQLAALQAMKFANDENARSVAARSEAEALNIAWQREGDKYLTKRRQMEREIARETGSAQKQIAAGLLTEEDLRKRIAAIREKYTDATGQSEVAGIKARTQAQQQYLDLLKTQGLEAQKMTEGEKLVIQIKQQLTTSLTGVQRAEKLRALAAAESLAVVDKQVQGEELRLKGLKASRDAYDAMVDATRKSADQLKTQADELEASNAMWGKGKVAIEQYKLALLEAKAAEIDANPDSYRPDYVAAQSQQVAEQRRKVIATQAAEYKALLEKQTEYARNLAEEGQLYQDEIGLLGVTSREREKIVAIRRVEMDLAKQIAEINRSGANDDQKQTLIAQAEASANVAKQIATAKSELNSMTDIINSVDRTAQQVWTNIFQGGGNAFKKIGDVIKASVLDLLYQLTIKKWVVSITANVIGAVTGSAISGTASAASSGSLVSAGSNALGLTGLGSTFGTGALATVQGWMGMSGTAAQTSAAFAQAFGAGSASGIVSSIGAAAPYVAAAYAAYKVLSSLNGGETRTGGQYAVAYDGQVTNNRRGESYQYVGQQFNRDNSSGVRVTNGQAYLIEADGMGAQDKAVRDAVSGTATSIQETLKALGSKLTLTGFWAGMETSIKGRGGVFSGLSLSDGTQVGESGKGDNYSGTLYELTSTNSPDAATALANFTLDLKQVTIEALQAASDIPKTISDKLKGVDAEALTSDAADTLLSWVSTQISNVNALATVANSLPLQNLKNLSFDAASGLIELAGGLDTLTGQLNDYYTTYYSPEEQAANTLSNIKKSLEAVGLELPTSEQAFRALVEAQDQSTESGRKAFLALISVSKAFAAVTPSAEEAAAAIDAAAAKQAASAQQAALTALDSAYAALEASIAAQRTALQETAQAAQDAVSTIASIYQTLKQNVDELYNSVATTQAQGQKAALAFIDTTLEQARLTGRLPDGTSLSDAIAAARTGLGDAGTYASKFERDKAQLILAGKLAELQSIAGVQKTVAEQQLDAATAQLDKLDKTLDYWKTQVEIAKGTYKATLSITDAIKGLTKAILGVKDPATNTSGTTGGTDSSGFSAGPGSGQTFTLTGRDAENSALRQYWEKTFNLGNKASSLQQIYTDSKAYGITQARWAEVLGVNVQDMAELFGSVQIPAFAVGTNYVPSDMLAMIHQGEAIVPKAYNPAAGGVLQPDGQVARLLTALITEVQALRSSGDRTANALEGNQSSPLIVEVVNRVLNVKGTTA